MNLPKIDQPTYELKLPYTKKSIRYRPFLVKEEKLLLIAAQGKDQAEITHAIMQIVNNCITDLNGLKLYDIPSFEMDYIFLHMRAKSIGGQIEQEFECNNQIEYSPDDKEGEGPTKKCGMVMTIPIKVDEVHITEGPKTNRIQLNDKFGLQLKYPRFKTYDMDKEGAEYDILADCLDYVYDDKTTYSFKDNSHEEIIKFIDDLTKEQFKQIQDFYDAMPHLEIDKKFKCTKCGFEHRMRLEEPLDFF